MRGAGVLLGFEAMVPFRGESWNMLRELKLQDKVAAIQDEQFRQRLVDEVRESKRNWPDPEWVFCLGNDESPDLSMGDHNQLKRMAERANEHWCETFLRLTAESNGRVLFNVVEENQNLKALGDMFDGGLVFPGVGDAGAHVTYVMDAGWATFVLAYWIREKGLFSMGEGIRRLTSAPARILGLTDRGALKPGNWADINIFDADKVAEGYPHRVHDFPGGAPRLTQPSIGYKATLVNGQFNVLNGTSTHTHAGKVLRHAS